MKKNGKRKESILSIREKKLAYSLILPTMILVLSVVIIPLLANFWISFKPISLGDLRPPKLILKESIRSKLSTANDFATIQYKYRNSSSKYELNEVAFSDLIPKGITVSIMVGAITRMGSWLVSRERNPIHQGLINQIFLLPNLPM